MSKMTGESMNITEENIKKLQELFPDIVCDGKVDFDKLKQNLGEFVDDDTERYNFTWNGKGRALRLSQTPSMGTLRPCKEESVDWDNTENFYIEGDNLEVLKLLQKSYYGKVKMIYIDPPYNTGNDFVYPDDFKDSIENYKKLTGQVDDENYSITTNTESNGRFHTKWLNMFFSRIRLARNLIRDDGVIFISIDDNEVMNMCKLCDEVFGEDKRIAIFPRITKKAGKTTDIVAKNHDYIIAYSKTNYPLIYLPEHTDEGFKYSDKYEKERGKYKLNQTLDYDSLQYSDSLDYPITINGKTFYAGQSYDNFLERKKGNHARADWAWRWSKELFEFGYENDFIVVKEYENHSRIYTKTYEKATIKKCDSGYKIEYTERTKSISSVQFIENKFSNDNAKKNLVDIFQTSVFDYSKPVALIEELIRYTTRNDDIVMDFFSGSGTLAEAVLKVNFEDGQKRRFMCVQLPEKTAGNSEARKQGYSNLCEIGLERIRRVGGQLDNRFDTGFKVFKLDNSNLKKWQPKENLEASILDYIDNFMEDGRTDLDVVYEIMLKMGLDLNYPIETICMENGDFYSIGYGTLMICLADEISEEVANRMVNLHDELQPAIWKVVFKDNGFSSDSSKTNIKEILKCAGLAEEAFTTI